MDTCGISTELQSELQSLLEEDEAQELSIKYEIQRYMQSSEFQEIILEASKQKKTRKTSKRANYWDSEWGRLLQDPRVYNLKSKAALRFKRRFRVNIYMFDQILHMCFDRYIFHGINPHGNCIDIEFKVLICLRKLGRYEVDDTSSELSYVGESTIRELFEKFVTNFSKEFYTAYVNVPSGDKLKQVMEVYRKLGVPGCIGSLDCTHIFWNMCPAKLRVECTGKHSKPTLVFQAVVDHNGRCMSLSKAFYGTKNDKTIALNDTFTVDMLSGIFKNIEFPLYGSNGDIYVCKGAYCLADNGYHKWACLIPPHKFPSSRDDVLWSEWIESVRKDIECYFGKIKARWQFLKSANRCHSVEIIEKAFQCCCILHNMLLDQSEAMAEDPNEANTVHLEALDPNFDDPDEVAWEQAVEQAVEIVVEHASGAKRQLPLEDAQANELTMFNFKTLSTKEGVQFSAGFSDFDKLRRALTNSFLVQFYSGKVSWPQRMANKKQKSANFFNLIADRVQKTADNFLYIEDSSIYAYNNGSQINVGLGLFSSISYDVGSTIAIFKGDLVSLSDLLQKRIINKKRVGYAVVTVKSDMYLDTYDYYLKRQCWASYANSTWMARYKDSIRNEDVVANAEIFYSQDGRIGLRAKIPIWHDTEILWDGYGPGKYTNQI
jgi:hypothetical protein